MSTGIVTTTIALSQSNGIVNGEISIQQKLVRLKMENMNNYCCECSKILFYLVFCVLELFICENHKKW